MILISCRPAKLARLDLINVTGAFLPICTPLNLIWSALPMLTGVLASKQTEDNCCIILLIYVWTESNLWIDHHCVCIATWVRLRPLGGSNALNISENPAINPQDSTRFCLSNWWHLKVMVMDMKPFPFHIFTPRHWILWRIYNASLPLSFAAAEHKQNWPVKKPSNEVGF